MKKRDEELQKIQLSMSEIDLSISEIEQRVNTISGREGPPELPGPLVSEWLPAESRPEVEALLTKRTALVTEWTAPENQAGSDCGRGRGRSGGWLTNTTGRKSKIAPRALRQCASRLAHDKGYYHS